MANKIRAYEGNEPYVFISYAHKDSESVFKVLSALQERGLRIWYDDGIAPGSEWPEYIATHLDNAEAVIAFITDNSVNSPNCRREVTFALSRNKPFVSVFLEQTEIPLGLELQISAQQSVLRYNFETEEGFINKLFTTPSFKPCIIKEEPAPVKTTEKAPETENTDAEKVPVKEASVTKQEFKKEPVKTAKQPSSADDAEKKKKMFLIGGIAAAAVVVLIIVFAVVLPGSKKSSDSQSAGTQSVSESAQGSEKETAQESTGSQTAAQETVPEETQAAAEDTEQENAGTENTSEESTAESQEISELEEPEYEPVVIDPETDTNTLGDLLDGVETYLSVSDYLISPNIIKEINELPKLNNLYFENCEFSQDVLKDLKLQGEGSKAIRIYNSVGINNLDFLTGMTEGVYLLTLQNCGITDDILPDLSGIAINELDLSENKELTKVSLDLTALRSLNMSGTALEDISFLEKAENLNYLILNNTPVSDLTPIIPLTDIKTLSLSGTGVTSFDEEFEFLGLRQLLLNGCGLTSIKGIQDYVELETLDLGNNSITDVSFLEDIAPNLLGLDISGNDIGEDDLKWLDKAVNMKQIIVDHIDLGSMQLGFVKNMPDLEALSARDCSISDLSGLSEVQNLKILLLGFNNISDIAPLETMCSLGNYIYLDLAQNQITDFSVLTGDFNELSLFGNPITAYKNENDFYASLMLIDYFEGMGETDIANALIGTVSVAGCPRSKQKAVTDVIYSAVYHSRAEQIEFANTEMEYVRYDGFEDLITDIEEE